MNTNKSNYIPYLMWFLPLLFFNYQFILRLWPGVMMDVIREQVSVNATKFGLIASVYYLGYSTAQIPIAMLIDKYSVKYVLFTSGIVCGIATIIFSYTDNWLIAFASRLLVGIGSAAGFLTVSNTISKWFPKNKYSSMVAMSFTFGLLGAVYGSTPVEILATKLGVTTVTLILSIVSITIGILALVFLKKQNNADDKNSELDNQIKISDLTKVVSSPTIWILAIANLLMVGSLEGFGDVWGMNYLISAYALEKKAAASFTSLIFVGMLFGGPILAILARYLGNHFTIVFCGFGMALICGSLFYLELSYNFYLLAVMFTLLGIFCCYQVIVFSIGNDLADSKLLGMTIAFLNSINMLGGSFFHSIIGYLMDFFWQGELKEDGVAKIYNAANYSYALGIIPICAVIGSLMVIYVNFKCGKKIAY